MVHKSCENDHDVGFFEYYDCKSEGGCGLRIEVTNRSKTCGLISEQRFPGFNKPICPYCGKPLDSHFAK